MSEATSGKQKKTAIDAAVERLLKDTLKKTTGAVPEEQTADIRLAITNLLRGKLGIPAQGAAAPAAAKAETPAIVKEIDGLISKINVLSIKRTAGEIPVSEDIVANLNDLRKQALSEYRKAKGLPEFKLPVPEVPAAAATEAGAATAATAVTEGAAAAPAAVSKGEWLKGLWGKGKAAAKSPIGKGLGVVGVAMLIDSLMKGGLNMAGELSQANLQGQALDAQAAALGPQGTAERAMQPITKAQRNQALMLLMRQLGVQQSNVADGEAWT